MVLMKESKRERITTTLSRKLLGQLREYMISDGEARISRLIDDAIYQYLANRRRYDRAQAQADAAIAASSAAPAPSDK